MNQEMVDRLSVITEEEKEILNGRTEIDRARYTEGADLVIDSGKMLEHGKLIRIRPHTRFVHFPKHKHNFIEVIYMCEGETTHFIDGDRVVLQKGELLFLNQHATQEILPAGEHDIAVNFIILPEFFNTAFEMSGKSSAYALGGMVGEEENLLRDFLVGCLCNDTRYASYIHFKVADVLPVQNLVENMVWTLLNDQPNKRSINQVTMGLLFLQLMHCTDKISHTSESFEQKLIFQVLGYIDENYRDGELKELASMLGYDIYWLSRAIKRLTGRNYKDLLQIKRLNQAAFLLLNTRLPVADICQAVGYDNTSYFYRIFKERYQMSPKEYRRNNRAL